MKDEFQDDMPDDLLEIQLSTWEWETLHPFLHAGNHLNDAARRHAQEGFARRFFMMQTNYQFLRDETTQDDESFRDIFKTGEIVSFPSW